MKSSGAAVEALYLKSRTAVVNCNEICRSVKSSQDGAMNSWRRDDAEPRLDAFMSRPEGRGARRPRMMAQAEKTRAEDHVE